MTYQKDNFFRKNRYSLLWVMAFILIVVLHSTGVFYNEAVEVVEDSDTFKPLIVVVPVMLLTGVIQYFKLLGRD